MSPHRPSLGRRLARGARRRLGRGLARAAAVVGGPSAIRPADHEATESSWGRVPRHWQVKPPSNGVGEDWPTPPNVDHPQEIVDGVYDTGRRPVAMDVPLGAARNEENRSKPLVPEPLQYDQDAVEDRARRRLVGAHRQIGLSGKRVLEFGCGTGFEVWYLAHHFGSEAWGVDVVEREGWGVLRDDRTRLVRADIATDRPFQADFFDRIISFTVLEHVVHPHAVLSELYRVLKPGGLASISANLHRGPKASHLYRELHFPFPHLLFSDDVIRAYRETHSREAAGAYWVNRLTWAQYEDYLHAIGFRIRALRFDETPLDEAFYERFSDILGRYPRWDLERDFFHVVLEKPRSNRSGRPSREVG
ncbi:MAG: class I SAM-dependent methyltransferase [Chloroflexota bacterium]